MDEMRRQLSRLGSSLIFATISLLVLVHGHAAARNNYQDFPCPGSALVYGWTPPEIGSHGSLGTLFVHGEGISPAVPLLHPVVAGQNGFPIIQDAVWTHDHILVITGSVDGKIVHIKVSPKTTDKSIRINITSEDPYLFSIQQGDWDVALHAAPILVPYLGNVYYAPGIGHFLNSWWDWRSTHATYLKSEGVKYTPKTDGSRLPLHDSLLVTMSRDIDDVFPSPGNPPSPYRAMLSGKLVLDIWTYGFAAIQEGFTELGNHGISNCIAIIHMWQHAGFDNELPQHLPANSAWGGDDALRSAVGAGHAIGCIIALHENYVDYYPNFKRFDSRAISLQSDGQFQKAWKNGLGVQSFATRPAWMVRDAMMQSPEIHREYSTDADFLDVNSSAPIDSHADMNASLPEAGELTQWLEGSTNLWNYERRTHGGPVLGEGGNHWYYSGLLDGVEAEIRLGANSGGPGELAPLFVDFDLLRMHPREVDHGMGYYSRWHSHDMTYRDTASSDAYRMQELAFGHAPYLGRDDWNVPARAMVEQGLVVPVAQRYGDALACRISYQVDGRWTDASAAAVASEWSRVRVEYDNGLTVTANAGTNHLIVRGVELPQFGWLAEGAGVKAYTAIRDGSICDYAETATSIFANARSASDAETSLSSTMRSGPNAPSVAMKVSPDRLNGGATGTGRVVQFDSLQTDGMISLRLLNGVWTLWPEPDDRAFTVLLKKTAFRMPITIKAHGRQTSSEVPIDRGDYWRLPLIGATSYSWPASPTSVRCCSSQSVPAASRAEPGSAIRFRAPFAAR